ncbi:MAG: Ankyrin repeat [Rickettsiaceae bacterium]|jgi:hypothetical protein|nr:Ankyrin repeat [Rickettsiaceae bacterium]
MSAEKINNLLKDNRLAQDEVNFEEADKLLRTGATLPAPRKEEDSFSKKSEYLAHLSVDSRDLYIALRANPKIINEQDESGQTILHHAVKIGRLTGSNYASLILGQLFKADGVDFSIKDNDGNTPVHLAAHYCGDRVTVDFVFPNYVSAAYEAGFNFSELNNAGKAVLHILASDDDYSHFAGGQRNSVKTFIENAPNVDLNVFSATGATPLFYTLNYLKLNKATTLLEAGAAPYLYGSKDRNPLDKLKEFKDEAKKLEDSGALAPEKAQELKNNLSAIESLMEKVAQEQKKQKSDSGTKNWEDKIAKEKENNTKSLI